MSANSVTRILESVSVFFVIVTLLVIRITQKNQRLLNHPIDKVWAMIRPADFKFWTAVSSATVENGTNSEVGSQRKISFKDGSVQRYQIVELSGE